MPRIVIENLVEESFESAVVHDEQDTEWPVIQLVGRDVAKSARAQSRYEPSMWLAAFFPPALHPVLEGGEGNKNAMISP